jgi:hypothetical protein
MSRKFTRRMDGVYDILSYMTGESLFTHQLPRACDACRPALLKQHPQLSEVIHDHVNGDNYKDWLADQIARYGEELEVQTL